MQLHPSLKQLVDKREIGFEDIFAAYAALCVDAARNGQNAIIEDIGIEAYIKQVGMPTPASMTEIAVDWGKISAPEMLGDLYESAPKKDDESWLEFIIRRNIEQFVQKYNSFTIEIK